MVVVAIFIFYFLGNFGGEELVFVAEFWWEVVVWLYRRERERGKGREGRDESELLIFFNVVVYIILMSCI